MSILQATVPESPSVCPPICVEAGTIAVLVPARNEKDQIGATLESLFDQTNSPEQIIVICNNCTDGGATYQIAESFPGVVVLDLPNNEFKKAGALNAGINYLLAQDSFPQFVVTIDADTILDEYFIERSISVMASQPKLGGLSAVCRGKTNLIAWPKWRSLEVKRRHSHAKGGLVKARVYINAVLKTTLTHLLVWLQRAEYERAAVTRLRYNIHTLAGAGSILRAEAIFDVLGDRGMLYDERHDNLVEDYEATLEVKRHGWMCTNNFYCVAYTDLMLTLPALLRQRIRWVRGSIDELRRRGWQLETRMSILALSWGYAGIPLFYLWLVLLARVLITGHLHWQTAWIMLVVCAYQAWTLRGMSLLSKLVGFLLIPEQIFNFVRHAWLLSSVVTSYRAKSHNWD